MENFKVAVTILCIIAIILGLFFAFCRSFNIITWVTAWVLSNREEKVGLTRSKGHYNANGYLIHSDSDIHLDATGSFKRFDSVDRDVKITLATTSLTSGEWNSLEDDAAIPPQPLRPAPLSISPPAVAPLPRDPPPPPPTQVKQSSREDPSDGTSISPIPRPVSSLNMAQLASQCSFPVCLTPPPSPVTPAHLAVHTGRFSAFSPPQPQQQQQQAQGADPVVQPAPAPLEEAEAMPAVLKRAMSCESVCSDTSVALGDLEEGNITGYLCIGLEYDGAPTPSSSPRPRPWAMSCESVCSDTSVALGDLEEGNITGYLCIGLEYDGAPTPSSSPRPRPWAMSCESVCSDTSVALGDLEEGNITGYLCIGLEYDGENSDLIVNVLEAKDLVAPCKQECLLDSYVRVFLLPDKTTIQTKTCRGSGSPSYKERFLFWMSPREQQQKSLCFHVYAADLLSHTLIGEGEIRLADISLRQPVTTWVTLTDTGQRGTEFGELMFSLSYLPTAERLTVVVVKARNLKFQTDSTGDVFVKVYLLQQGKKVHKKKTSTKKGEQCPIFNESMMFSVPAHTLPTIHLRLTVSEPNTGEGAKAFAIGHVIVGPQATGRSLSHWNQMLTALRKPVAMWHSLRK